MEFDYIEDVIWKAGVFLLDTLADYPGGVPVLAPEEDFIPLNDNLGLWVRSALCAPTVVIVLVVFPDAEIARLIVPADCVPRLAEALLRVHRQTHPYDYELAA